MDQFNLKQFCLINKIAGMVNNHTNQCIPLNFYNCYWQYQNGGFCWVREANAFKIAVDIYDEFTSNDGWEIISDLNNYIFNMTAEEILKHESELSDYE